MCECVHFYLVCRDGGPPAGQVALCVYLLQGPICTRRQMNRVMDGRTFFSFASVNSDRHKNPSVQESRRWRWTTSIRTPCLCSPTIAPQLVVGRVSHSVNKEAAIKSMTRINSTFKRLLFGGRGGLKEGRNPRNIFISCINCRKLRVIFALPIYWLLIVGVEMWKKAVGRKVSSRCRCLVIYQLLKILSSDSSKAYLDYPVGYAAIISIT